MARTGVARICTALVAYRAHSISGRRIQVIPGARILWMVTMKFRPVKMDEKPRMKTPVSAHATGPTVVELYGV